MIEYADPSKKIGDFSTRLLKCQNILGFSLLSKVALLGM